MTDTPDIVDQLRVRSDRASALGPDYLALEAADEITRLRAELAEVNETIKSATEQARAIRSNVKNRAALIRARTGGLKGFAGRSRTPTR